MPYVVVDTEQQVAVAPAGKSELRNPFQSGGTVVSPTNPPQVFSSFEPDGDQGTGGVPGTVLPPDVG